MKNTKSQIYGQVFIYILTILLVSFILIYGYNAMQDFKDRAEQVSCLKFKEDLKSSIVSILSDFGSVKRKDFRVCNNYKEVCFVETYGFDIVFDADFDYSGIDPIIVDNIISKTGKNTFLVDNVAKELFYIGNISVDPDVFCINSKNSQISLRLEGVGNHVILSEWK